MADTYEQNLGQKSSLTTSDFIRVVGSDNVSYKQLVTSVLALNGTFYDDAWKANADLNNIKANGVYWISSSPTNAPTGLTWFPLVVIARSDNVRQMIITGGNVIWTRTYQSSVWSAWVRQPTRAEVDALNSSVPVTNTLGTLDLNTLPTDRPMRIYLQNVGNNATIDRHYPEAKVAGFLVQLRSNDWTLQVYFGYMVPKIFYRQWYDSMGTPPSWLTVS